MAERQVSQLSEVKLRSRWHQNMQRADLQILGFAVGLLVFFGLWQLLIWMFEIPPYLLATPQMALTALVEEREVIGRNALNTLGGTVAGLGVGSGFAFSLAMICVISPAAENAILPYAITLRSIPIVAIAPLITLIVGRGLMTSVVVVTIVSFFPMLVNAAQGLRSTSSSVKELMHVCGADPWQTFWLARFPFALPSLFIGLRTAAPASVLGAMLSEWLTGSQGLGYLIINSATRRELGVLWAVILVSTLLAVSIFGLVGFLEQQIVDWDRVESK